MCYRKAGEWFIPNMIQEHVNCGYESVNCGLAWGQEGTENAIIQGTNGKMTGTHRENTQKISSPSICHPIFNHHIDAW